MAVKKGILDNFLKPSSHYSDNQKNLRSIFIDKSADDFKPDPQSFLEATLLNQDNSQKAVKEKTLEVSAPFSLIESKKQQEDFKQTSKGDPNWHTVALAIGDKKPTTNRQQTDNKVATNREQTSNKVETNSPQLVDKAELKKENWQQSGNQTGNTIDNKATTKWQQTDNKVATKTAFSELVGLQRDIIILVCHECKNSRSRTTEALTLEYMSIALKRSAGAIKTTIQRLEKKGCLLRVAFKNGRGGWSKYELPDSMYHDVLRSETGNKAATNWQQTDNKVASQPTTEPATSISSSSSFLNNKETTTIQLNDEWNFDITPYARFGFKTSHIRQLASVNTVSAANVEQSLIEFTYDADNNSLPQIKTGKINFLMGLLRSGHSYVSEGFKNEQEAMISEMASRSEGKRKKLLEESFIAWEANLSNEQRKEIENKLPTQLMVLHRAYGMSNAEVRKWLFEYYLQKGSA